MESPDVDFASLRELAQIDPYDQEFPAWCTRCGGRWAIYRPPDTPYAVLHDAASGVHLIQSARCHVDHIRVAEAVPYGEAAPVRLTEHASSPFIQNRPIGSVNPAAGGAGPGQPRRR